MTALHCVSRLCKIIGGLITAMTHVNQGEYDEERYQMSLHNLLFKEKPAI